MSRFEGKTAVITGAHEGVGRIIALSMAKEGAKVILVSRGEPVETMQMIKEAGGTCLGFIRCDISIEEQVIEMAKQAGTLANGCVDILINNAGFNGKAHLVENMSLEDWKYTIDVNLTGTMLVCREMIPLMNKDGAAIVNMASNTGRRGIPYRADYSASKWALRGFTQTLALELVSKNIRVNAVCPGPINGDRADQLIQMHADAENKTYKQVYDEWMNVPMNRFIEPEEVANTVMFLASDDSSAMTGQALNVTGGFIMS